MSTSRAPDETPPARVVSRPRRNVVAVTAQIVGLIAVVLALLSPNRALAFAPALIGLVLSGVAIAFAVRRDARVAAAVTSLLLNLFALAVAVFALGAQAGGQYGG